MIEPSPREFERLTASVDKLTAVMEQLPEKLRAEFAETYVRKDVLGPQLTEIRNDIKGHDNWLTWAQRLLIGAVIVALLSLVIVQR